jgi:hypothetical protein
VLIALGLIIGTALLLRAALGSGGRAHQPGRPQLPGQQPGQRGQHRPVRPSKLGLGCWRRSTAYSCRSTSSSASFDADDGASNAVHPARQTNIR